MTTPTLKPGDRFEMTVRGTLDGFIRDDLAWLSLEGSGVGPVSLDLRALAAARITILEPELKVGRARTSGGETGHILHVDGQAAWFCSDTEAFGCVYRKTALHNIPEDQ